MYVYIYKYVRMRKHTSSINVQVVCDANNIITYVVARLSGSVHDSFSNSIVHRMVQDMDDICWLLGKKVYLIIYLCIFQQMSVL